MAIHLRHAAPAAILAFVVAAQGGRCLAAETNQDAANRYNSTDPTVPMKGYSTNITHIVADDLIKAQQEDAQRSSRQPWRTPAKPAMRR